MIAIDVMGGDFAPSVVLEAALQAAAEGVAVHLFGPEELIRSHARHQGVLLDQLPVAVTHASEVVGMDDEAVSAVRTKKKSSLVMAVEAVADGRAQAALSAGNSGAAMVAGMLLVGREPGIERTPLAGFVPGELGPLLVLDLGANADCKPHHLVQFAHLGAAFAQATLKREVTVGLLSNGEEDKKGNLVTKEAFALLKEEKLTFRGNVEPHDALRNKVDVLVCDGFVGNVFLKTLEAVHAQLERAFDGALSEALAGNPGPDGALLATALRRCAAARAESVNGGGALVLGIRQPVFVCHGAATAPDLYKAIKKADFYTKNR